MADTGGSKQGRFCPLYQGPKAYLGRVSDGRDGNVRGPLDLILRNLLVGDVMES